MDNFKKLIIKSPKSKIDEGINYIINTFNELKYRNIYNFFEFKINDKYNLEDIELLYILCEFNYFQSKIFLDNPYFLNNYFNETDLYKNYNLNMCIFILTKIQLVLYSQLRTKKKKFDKVKNYISELEKIYLLDINKEFYTKEIDNTKKQELLLDEFNKFNKKFKKYMFLLFWIIEKDINKNILDNNIINSKDYQLIDKITDIFLEDKPNFVEIDIIQKENKVFNNYKMFKELFID